MLAKVSRPFSRSVLPDGQPSDGERRGDGHGSCMLTSLLRMMTRQGRTHNWVGDARGARLGERKSRGSDD